jgi:hypothetical protein
MTSDAESVHTEPGFGPLSTTTLYEQLLSLLTGLWFEIDHNGGGDAHRFFTPDAELRFSDAVFRGTTEIVQVYANRSARGSRVSRHIVTNLQLLDVQATTARATSILLLFGEDGMAPRPTTTPALIGDVMDEFELYDGRWLIKSRWIQNLFIDPTTVLAVPNE